MTQQEKQLRDKRRRRAKALSKPTPVELPSGKYRCQVTVNGKRISIVDEDPPTAHAKPRPQPQRAGERRAHGRGSLPQKRGNAHHQRRLPAPEK